MGLLFEPSDKTFVGDPKGYGPTSAWHVPSMNVYVLLSLHVTTYSRHAAHPGSLDSRLDDVLGLDVGNVLPQIRHPGLASLRNRDCDFVHSNATVENPGSRHLVRQLE